MRQMQRIWETSHLACQVLLRGLHKPGLWPKRGGPQAQPCQIGQQNSQACGPAQLLFFFLTSSYSQASNIGAVKTSALQL